MKICRDLYTYSPYKNKVSKQEQSIHSYNSFFKNLFQDLVSDKIIENKYYVRSESETPLNIIKSWQPHRLKENMNGYLSPLDFDKQFSIHKVQREIKLSYPTEEEALFFNLINKSMIVVEKNKIINSNHQIIRYEEVVFKTDTYIYED